MFVPSPQNHFDEWWRERRDRAAEAFCHQHAVGRFHRHPGVIGDAAEAVLLRVAAQVGPRHARKRVRRETAQPSFIDVGDRVLLGLGNRLHAHEVRAAIDGEAQLAGALLHRSG